MYTLGEFFGDDMLFYTFDDFIRRRHYIKSQLLLKDYKYRVMYRLYIEARPWVKDCYRGCIWDYLNNYMNDDELLSCYNKYCSSFRKRGDFDE